MRKFFGSQGFPGSFRAGAAAVVLLAGLFLSGAAQAQCETMSSVKDPLSDLVKGIINDTNDFIKDVAHYSDRAITETALNEIMTRLKEYDNKDDSKKYGLYPALDDWWKQTLPALKSMTKQLSMARLDQSRQIGSMLDARILNEGMKNKQRAQAESRQRYTPSEMTCQVDTVGRGQTKAYYVSRAMARTITLNDLHRRQNYKQSQPPEFAENGGGLLINSAYASAPASGQGRGAWIKTFYDGYCQRYFDRNMGDVGCPTQGTMPGEDMNLPGMLWSAQQTVDLTNAENRQKVDDALRTLIDPFPPEPIPPGVTASSPGKEALLMRRARDTRINAVYNVMAQMVGERSPGSGVSMKTDANGLPSIRLAAGVPVSAVSANASYSEIRQALSKERFLQPSYIVRLVTDPEAVMREQGAVEAIQSQLVNDYYKRVEEMSVMEAGVYADYLDWHMPANAHEDRPF